MSNLIPRNGPNPDLAVQGVQTIQVRDLGPGKGSPEAEAGDGIKPRELWRAIKRRKKLVGLTAGVIFVLTGLNTAHERLFRPVYQGSFTLLITDPISNEGRGGASTAASGQMFQQLALNTTSNDIPTLIALLQSPLLLEPVAKRFNLSSGALANRIQISTGGSSRREASGVLNVSITGRNPMEDEALLTAISNAYLQAALQERQQRLADGIAFLTKQAPALEQKTEAIQAELAAFRRQHSLLEPTVEGGALKDRETGVATQILELQAERARLQNVRKKSSPAASAPRGSRRALGVTAVVFQSVMPIKVCCNRFST